MGKEKNYAVTSGDNLVHPGEIKFLTGGIMMKQRLLRVCVGIVVSFWLMTGLLFNAVGAETRGEKEVDKALEAEIGFPILNGDLWKKMKHDDKVAFIWGFWHVVAIENYLREKHPELKVQNFSCKVIEATNKKRLDMNGIVTLINIYYQKNPGEMEKPVVAVLWDELIKPNINTGIAGCQLKR